MVPRSNSCYACLTHVAEFPQHPPLFDECCGNPNNASHSSPSKFLVCRRSTTRTALSGGRSDGLALHGLGRDVETLTVQMPGVARIQLQRLVGWRTRKGGQSRRIAVEPYLKVLHGIHLIPSLSLNGGGNVDSAAGLDRPVLLARKHGLRILRIDEDAVTAAFAWMNDADDLFESPHDEGLVS